MVYQQSLEIERRLQRVLPSAIFESRTFNDCVDRQKDALLDEISRRLQQKAECSELFSLRRRIA